MINRQAYAPLHILLADDDFDDRFFFGKALDTLPIQTELATVSDGDKLLVYLSENLDNLPDVLFLDLNMPCKNGEECLTEIRSNKVMDKMPVIIYSTSLNETIADVLYQKGAQYYLRKCDYAELRPKLHKVLTLLASKQIQQPSREKFILDMQEL